MRVGVPKETAPGERRVALSPDVVRRLGKDHEVVVEAGAGEAAGVPDEQFTDAGRDAGRPLGRRRGRQGRGADRGRDRPPQRRLGPDRLPRPAHQRPGHQGDRRHRRDVVRDGGDPAHLARPVDGRALQPGDRRRLPRRADRRVRAGPLLPDADDRRGHDPARPGARAGRGRGRAAGDRDLAPARRRRHRLRHPLRRQGADPVARREVLRGRGARRRRGRGRLRPRAHAGGAGDPEPAR